MSSAFFVGNYDYCESSRSIDNMLEQFSKDRKKTLSLLKTNKLIPLLWSDHSPISKDDNCLFSMGKSLTLSIEDILQKKNDVSDSLINFYVCPQCRNMKRIIDFTKTKSNQPFVLECGEKAGSSLIFNEMKISRLYTTLEKEPTSVKKAYQHPSILELANCSSATCPLPKGGNQMLNKYADMNYLGSDPFTNNMLINWYLNDELSAHSIPNISTIYMSWVCNKTGYNLYEYSDIATIASFQEHSEFLTNSGKLSPTAKADDKSPINSEVVSGIISQLFATLHFLQKYDFSHGNPGTESLRFENKPVSYIVDGVHITSPVTLKIENFTSSGCTVIQNKTRLYSKSIIAEETLRKKCYDPIIETADSENVTIYRLKDPKKYVKSSVLFMYMKHLGLPIYSSSFDAYAFMIVCMCERGFYSTVLRTPELNEFWKKMWLDEDFEKVNERIQEYHEKSDFINSSDTLSILNGLGLRCDMISFGWKNLKNL